MTKFIPVRELDPIVFANDLLLNDILPSEDDAEYDHKSRSGISQPAIGATLNKTTSAMTTGTFKGTQKALTAAYGGILNSHATYFDIAGYETYLPRGRTSLDAAREIYTWSVPSKEDNYPPHLAKIPYKDSTFLTKIFNWLRLAESAPLLERVIPDKIIDFFYDDPSNAATIQGVVDLNQNLHKKGGGVFGQPNIGDRNDWYTDAVFAQQQLTGTNPVTLSTALPTMMDAFIAEASARGNNAAVDILTGQAPTSHPNDSFYVQDCSWFRTATKLGTTGTFESDDGKRHTGAPIALFQLIAATGKLHPLAICLDYKGPSDPVNLSGSVILFNSRLHTTDDTSEERSDWPWRYAKTVVQCADWHRHEIAVHLTEAHFVEEATIVAANRAFPETHIVYQLLSPHWLKTLSLNSSGRDSLVPKVIAPIAGMNNDHLFTLCRYNYTHFDFVGHYIPNDLKRRGFPEDQLQGVKFHNCAYARDISLFWNRLRKFVSAVLKAEYASNGELDQPVRDWSSEMRDPKGGAMLGFTDIKTVEELIDAVTACIHIASPLHSAVNYLQNYYYAFVINKPSALYTRIPEDLDSLKAFTEQDLVDALPIRHARDWLIGSHIPWLLSYQVSDNQNILTWAATIANTTAGTEKDIVLSSAARHLHEDLVYLAEIIQRNSDALDDQATPYTVLTPKEVAVSILI